LGGEDLQPVVVAPLGSVSSLTDDGLVLQSHIHLVVPTFKLKSSTTGLKQKESIHLNCQKMQSFLEQVFNYWGKK